MEEKLEFLKREEIRTMQKDIARLREIEAKKERKKIMEMVPKEIEREKIEKIKRGAEERKKGEEKAGILIPKILKKTSPYKKILVRTLILSFLLLSIFFFWYLEIRKPKLKEVIPPKEAVPEEVTPPKEVEKPEIVIPLPLIPVESTKNFEISKNEEIPRIFSQLMAEELPLGSFTRLIIKNSDENRLSSLEDLSIAFQIDVPKEIFEKLEKDYTLAIYSQKEGKRTVLMGKVKESEGLLDILKNWEKKIEKEGIYFSGKKISTLFPYFKTNFYKDIGFRYLTISKNDLGICYAWFKNYFLFANSFEGLKEAINRIKSGERIGQLFIVGFEGKTLTPELEKFFKKYKPGGLLLLSKNIENKEQLKKLISDLQNLSLKETGLPLFVAVDQEGKISKIDFLEEKTPQSKIENQEMAYQIGLKRGKELKEIGVNLNLAPLLDFTREGDFLFERSFQKDPKEIGNLANSLISGQKEAKILTAIKHFPGYGGISFNPEEKLATLEKVPEISQFKMVMEKKPEMVMTSNIIYNEIDPHLPFTFSSSAIQFLKNYLGSEILILTDDLDQNSLLNEFTLKEIVTKPIEAGVDILIFSGYRLPVEKGLDEFLKAFENGEVSKEKIEKAISRIIQLKQKFAH